MKIDSHKINQTDTKNLEFFKANKNISFFSAKKDKIDFIFNTSALEGNAMTYPEVQTLLEGITIGGHKLEDEQQILNQNRSVNLLFKMLEEETFQLNKSTLCKLHKKVAFEEALTWGEFRTGNVNIGGTSYLPPKPAELDNIFKDGISEVQKIKHPIIKGITYFLFGAKNQFFFDGNKRVSRLMMNGILLTYGFPILNIKAKDKLEINKCMIEFYDGKEIEKTLLFFIDYYINANKHLTD